MARKFYKEDNETTPSICFCESPAPIGFTEITDQVELAKLYVSKYEERRIEGTHYVDEYTAQLYLDFINLFLFLLRFMGKRRD